MSAEQLVAALELRPNQWAPARVLFPETHRNQVSRWRTQAERRLGRVILAKSGRGYLLPVPGPAQSLSQCASCAQVDVALRSGGRIRRCRCRLHRFWTEPWWSCGAFRPHATR